MSQTPPRPPGRPRSADPTFTMTLRLPQSLGGLMDGYLGNRQRTEPGLTRQDVIREAIVRYIAPASGRRKPAAGKR